VSGQGAGRRLTPDEEERGRQLFADGLSTRQVAAELGIGNGTAARLRQRLADRGQITPAAGDPETEETTVTSTPDVAAADVDEDQADDAELAQLHQRQEELTAEATMYVERAEASRAAVSALEAERMQLLAAGQDAQQLRTRRRDAEDDLRDSVDAASIAQGALAVVGERIAAIEARQADRRLRAELADAVAERDQVLAGIGARQRAAVLAVRQAAEEFTQTFADEQRVMMRVDELAGRVALGGPAPDVPLPVTTRLSVPGDAGARGPVALLRAMYQARDRNVTAVAEQLGVADGWLPPDPAEVEAERQRIIALHAAMPAARPPEPGSQVQMDPRYGSSYSVDEHGRPLRAPDPARQAPVAPMGPGGHIGGWPL